MDDSSESPIEAGNSIRELRSVQRYGLIAQTEIVEPTSGLGIAGRLSEISSRGRHVDMLNTLPLETAVEVHVCRDQGTWISRGRIIYAQDGMGMGIAFLEIPDDQSKILCAWLEDLQPL